MTYDYACVCGRRFERARSVAHRDDVTCVCGRTPRRVISRVQIVIPAAFSTATGRQNVAQPQNNEERAAWDDQGVRAFKDSDGS